VTAKNERYVKSKFSIAAEMLAGSESLPTRVARAWTEISTIEGWKFDDPAMQQDFDWLMSKRSIFAVGDGMPARELSRSGIGRAIHPETARPTQARVRM
jgi:hypothetical protein